MNIDVSKADFGVAAGTATAIAGILAHLKFDNSVTTALTATGVIAIVLFNNLPSLPATKFQCPPDDEGKAALALEIDRAMRERAPAGWKGDAIREKQVLNALFPLMNRDREATSAIFDIIKQQPAYS